ncbi:MAG: type I restriction endonuclease subunit R, partial [Chloroflexota bacterium]|jgi:type I restriction enzyme R subunit
MYVDRKLDGIQTVRTLSLLAIPYPGKEEVVVLDFANEPEDIRKAFAPYYDRTIPEDVIDPRRLEPMSTELASFNLYYQPEVERVVFYALNAQLIRGAQDALWPVIQRYLAANDVDRERFSTLLRDYLRHYSYISNWLPLKDRELEKLFIFGRYLLQRLPLNADILAVDIKTRVENLLPRSSYAP